MEEKSLEELKKLAEEAQEHSSKTVELFDEAQKLEQEIITAAGTPTQRELIEKVRKINRKAIAEAHKVIEIENELLLKEREAIETRLKPFPSIETAPLNESNDE